MTEASKANFDWRPDFEQCTTIPELFAVLLLGIQRNATIDSSADAGVWSGQHYQMEMGYAAWLLRSVLEKLVAAKDSSKVSKPTQTEILHVMNRLPSTPLRTALLRIMTSPKFSEKPLYGIKLADKIITETHKDAIPDERAYVRYERQFINGYGGFDNCQTLTDIMAVLSGFYANFAEDDTILSNNNIIQDLTYFNNKIEVYNKSLDSNTLYGIAEPFSGKFGLKAAIERIVQKQVQSGKPFSNLHLPVVTKLKDDYAKEVADKKEREEYRTIETRRIKQTERIRRVQEAEPKPRAGFFGKPFYAGMGAALAAALVGIELGHFIEGLEKPVAAESSKTDDTAIQFEDAITLHNLTAEQAQELKTLLETGDKYYLPFVEALMRGSKFGITSDGRLSSDPIELIKGLENNNRRLHDLIDNGQVKSYIAHAGREDGWTFGQSAAAFMCNDPSNPMDDLMVLDQYNFFASEWHKIEMLEHETGHSNPMTRRPFHNGTVGRYDRTTAAFGDVVLSTTDYSYYLSTMFSAADTVIEQEVRGAQNEDVNGGWHSITTPADKKSYAHALARYFMKYNTVLEPYGISEKSLTAAITSSHLIELANIEAQKNLDRIHAENEKPIKKIPSEINRRHRR